MCATKLPLLNLMFCAASLCQGNSTKSSPIMRDEVGKHMAQDLRPFLHVVSLQILQILRSTLVDSASRHPASFSCVFLGVLRIMVLLKGPTTAHFKPPG